MTSLTLPKLAFYEKPGCSSNAKQKAQLKAIGFELDVRDLLTAPWTGPALMEYFGSSPVRDWFNKSAPAVRDGLIKPDELNADQAIELMLKEPLLIRRPLISSISTQPSGYTHQQAWVGFNLAVMLAQLGLPADLASGKPQVSEACTGSSIQCETHKNSELKQEAQ